MTFEGGEGSGKSTQLQRLGARLAAEGRKVVMTRFDESKSLCREAHASLKSRYGDNLCETRIQDDPALSESPAHGMDIFAYSADSPGAHDYRLLTMELLSKGFFQ